MSASASPNPSSSNIGYMMPIYLLICMALVVAAVTQYRSVILELHEGASSNMARKVLTPWDDSDPDATFGVQIALVRSANTLATMGEMQDNFDNIIGVWEKILRLQQFPYKIVDQVPDPDDSSSYNMIVLPYASAMSQEEIDNLKVFLKQGNGVVMTWATGTRDEHGKWRKYSVLQEICGIDPSGMPQETSHGRCSFVMLKNQAVSALIPSGLSVELSRYDQPLSAQIREERTIVDAVWNDREDSRFDEATLFRTRKQAAIAHGDYFDGRFVWFGFPIGSTVSDAEQANAVQDVVRESLLWASRQIRFIKPTWPGGQPAVLSITRNFRTGDTYDQELAKLAEKHRIPLTSFVTDAFMESNPEAMQALAGTGEMGVLLDSDDPRIMNSDYLKKLRKKVKAYSGSLPQGCRLSGDLSSSAAQAIVKAGYSYVSSVHYERMVPEILRTYRPIEVITRPRYLWLMPEMQVHADEEDSDGSLNPQNAMLLQLSKALAFGGYCCLSLDDASDAASRKELAYLLNKAQQANVWVTSAGEIADTWAWWGNLKLTNRPISPLQTRVQISNTGTRKAPASEFRIDLLKPARQIRIEAMALGGKLPKLSPIDEEGLQWSLRMNDLNPGNNLAYKLHIEPRT